MPRAYSAALDAVFVNYAQGPEVFVFGVVVAGEAEGVEGVEPAYGKRFVSCVGVSMGANETHHGQRVLGRSKDVSGS